MSPLDQDTIFAPATGAGRAAISVVRLSGPACRSVVETLAGAPVPPPRRLTFRTLREPGTREPLDDALLVWLPGPRTFTGEDQAELHIHGGLAVRQATLRALSGFDRCRPAEPGEFTRRSFLNGRLDLTRVEGLADLIDAETEAQRRQALKQLEGRLGRTVEAWRERLLGALAALEAALDFSDEADVAAERLQREAGQVAADVGRAIAGELGRGPAGERLREGFTVVIAGPANAGKSSLLNALARRDVAIVSPTPGTTRDTIEVRCDLGGLPVTFVDTAGLRDTRDAIEREGVNRMVARAQAADLVLWLEAPDMLPAEPPEGVASDRVLRIRTKQDLAPSEQFPGGVAVSTRTGAGLDRLLARVGQRLGSGLPEGDALLTRERHVQALALCCEALNRIEPALRQGAAELAAEDMRLAVRALGRITGRVDVEDVLDRLFASFCIGK